MTLNRNTTGNRTRSMLEMVINGRTTTTIAYEMRTLGKITLDVRRLRLNISTRAIRHTRRDDTLATTMVQQILRQRRAMTLLTRILILTLNTRLIMTLRDDCGNVNKRIRLFNRLFRHINLLSRATLLRTNRRTLLDFPTRSLRLTTALTQLGTNTTSLLRLLSVLRPITIMSNIMRVTQLRGNYIRSGVMKRTLITRTLAIRIRLRPELATRVRMTKLLPITIRDLIQNGSTTIRRRRDKIKILVDARPRDDASTITNIRYEYVQAGSTLMDVQIRNNRRLLINYMTTTTRNRTLNYLSTSVITIAHLNSRTNRLTTILLRLSRNSLMRSLTTVINSTLLRTNGTMFYDNETMVILQSVVLRIIRNNKRVMNVITTLARIPLRIRLRIQIMLLSRLLMPIRNLTTTIRPRASRTFITTITNMTTRLYRRLILIRFRTNFLNDDNTRDTSPITLIRTTRTLFSRRRLYTLEDDTNDNRRTNVTYTRRRGVNLSNLNSITFNRFQDNTRPINVTTRNRVINRNRITTLRSNATTNLASTINRDLLSDLTNLNNANRTIGNTTLYTRRLIYRLFNNDDTRILDLTKKVRRRINGTNLIGNSNGNRVTTMALNKDNMNTKDMRDAKDTNNEEEYNLLTTTTNRRTRYTRTRYANDHMLRGTTTIRIIYRFSFSLFYLYINQSYFNPSLVL